MPDDPPKPREQAAGARNERLQRLIRLCEERHPMKDTGNPARDFYYYQRDVAVCVVNSNDR